MSFHSFFSFNASLKLGIAGDSVYGLLTKCEVKMAGYRPSSFFACLWTSTAASVLKLKLSSILPARVANHSAGFDSSCPLHIIKISTDNNRMNANAIKDKSTSDI